jgi:hypothetical protein
MSATLPPGEDVCDTGSRFMVNFRGEESPAERMR